MTLAGIATLCLPVPVRAVGKDMADGLKKEGLVFLFQGDSITDGKRGRNQDPNHIMGHGYAFAVAGRVGADHPEKKLTFFNRGISGNKITDLENRWDTDTLALKPDVLSILVGVNDAASVVEQHNPVPVGQYAEVYDKLLTRTRAQNPDILLVLCEPFLLPVGKVKDNWQAWHTDVLERQQVVKKLAAAHNAVFVPFQKMFNQAVSKAPADYWIWDGVHPTVAGHELMAREWLQQVSRKLSFLQKSVR